MRATVLIFALIVNGCTHMTSICSAEGFWTPEFSFATPPPDLSVTYASRDGIWWREGNRVHVEWDIQISGITFTPTPGEISNPNDVHLKGIPFASKQWTKLGSSNWQGFIFPSHAKWIQLGPNTQGNRPDAVLAYVSSDAGYTHLRELHVPNGATLPLAIKWSGGIIYYTDDPCPQ